MAVINEYYPEEVFHPCETLNEKLNEMGMSRKEFALRTGKPEKTIIDVLKGKSSITVEMAILFENITKIPAKFWINKQARYNEYKARKQRGKDVENALEWAKSFPYSAMARLNWVPATRDIKEKAINLFEFFAISNSTSWDRLYLKSELKVAAYASLKHTHDPHAISAWLRRGELQAKEMHTPEYSNKKFIESLPLIKSIMAAHPMDFFQKLQDICASAGVKVFYTPKLPKVPISGSTRWINDIPIIQLTARYKQNDRFWFTFFHEAGHILKHGKKYISLENIDFSEADPKKEKEAHEFAEEWTFSKEQEKKVIENKYLTTKDIVNYAKEFNTHPAMIIGRLQHKKLIPFSIGRDFIKPIDLSD